MENTPDIAKVVGLIMQNPELIETIKGMIGNSERPQDDAPDNKEVNGGDATEAKEVSVTERASTESDGKRKRRNTLLQALKPYVSENRSRAIDTMMTIADMLDAVKGG